MLHDEKKVAKIIEELTMFFFDLGGQEISSSIKLHEGKAYIYFHSNYDLRYAHKLKVMEDFLKCNKNDGMEDIYWELVGSGDPGETSQLLLIGMMVDKATILVDGEYVNIELEKRMR